MKNYTPNYRKILGSTLLSLLITMLSLTLIWGIVSPDPSADAEIFTRLTRELPNYSTSASWIRADRPDLHWQEPYMPDKIFDDAYEKPIWVHPPLANILAWPFVKLIQNERVLKIIPVILFIISLYLIYLTLRRSMVTWKVLVCFSVIPLMTTAVYGIPYFYHDAFMNILLALSIYLIGKKSRWKYLAITALVLTKSNAAIFLIPLALMDKNWKLLLPGLGFFAYIGLTWYVTGTPLYVFEHWNTMSYYIKLHYEGFLLKNPLKAIIYSGYYIYVPILLFSIYRTIRLRSKPYAPIFGIIGILLASWAIIPYQMGAMLIILPIMMSIIPKVEDKVD